jgi:hypothetical protein
MSAKRAKLNLDFGHGGISINFAIANDFQPRDGMESDWSVGTLNLNSEEFEDFPGASQDRPDENHIKIIADLIKKIVSEWQRDNGCDFDLLMEITVSGAFFDVLYFPYRIEFSEFRKITESDMRKIEECKLPEKISQIQIPDEKMKALTSPYFLILDGKNTESRYDYPIEKITKSLGFNSYFITRPPMLSRLLEVMKEDGEQINVSLSCEKEFRAFASREEKIGKVALVHITNSITEFSVWENSELKYLNKKETGLKDLKKIIWRLCLSYYKNPMLIELDRDIVKKNEVIKKFYNTVKNKEISDDSKELLSADDCSSLLGFASCILDNETADSIKYSRLELPGKNRGKSGITISNYVFCYFIRETIRGLLQDIKQTMQNDNFCQPDSIIIECLLPLKGIEKLASEVFGIPARKAQVKWDGESREDLPSAGVGALQSLISEKEHKAELKKKTAKFSFFANIFSRA